MAEMTLRSTGYFNVELEARRLLVAKMQAEK
jgi:hypothetical protein